MKKLLKIATLLAVFAQPVYAMQEAGKETGVEMPEQKKLKEVFISHGLQAFIDKTDILKMLYEENSRIIEIPGIVSWFTAVYLNGSNCANEEKTILEDKIYAVLEEIFANKPETIKAMIRYKNDHRAENTFVMLWQTELPAEAPNRERS